MDYSKQINEKIYGLLLYGCIFYGCLMNFIMTSLNINILNYTSNMYIFYIVYFVLALTGILMSQKSDNPIISFIGYNLVVIPVGWVVDISIKYYGGIQSDIVKEAFLITLIVFGLMTFFAFICPKFCRHIGGILFISLLGLIIAEIIFLIFKFDNIMTAWIGAIIFTFYIAYDTRHAYDVEPTIDNAIDEAVCIYLDIINLFLKLLRILGNSRSSKN